MIPTKWDKVSTRQFMQFDKLQKVETHTDMERIDLLIKKASVLSGVSIEEAEKFPLTELDRIKVLANTPMNQKIYETFKLDGEWYEFILNPKELNAERYAGIMEAIKLDPIQGIQSTLFHLAKPFKLQLLRRKYYTLDESQIPKVLNDFGELPITVSYPIAVFFLTVLKKSQDYLEDYSIETLKEMKNRLHRAQTDLLKHTDGTKQSET